MPAPTAFPIPVPHALLAASPIAGAVAVFTWRLRETDRPLSVPRIVIPPAAMSTGFGMFLLPPFRVPWSWALGAFLLGALVLAWPLVRTSTLSRRGDAVVMRRSPALFVVLGALLVVRLALRAWVGAYLSVPQTGALFFVLAFGMIVRWRWTMLARFRALRGAGA
jgi:membrane protein CcdC involved in cytochrome C biogenesis